MKSQQLFNILEDFDFKLTDNPEFQEDSVREEIVLPILKGLGYSADKPNQIIRSRKLLHPFVSIGSQRKNIYIIPDYLLEVNNKPAWILDAKAPNEKVIKSENVEQAYSYAMHSAVRVNFFALCNGKEFALYNVQKAEPLLYFPTVAIPRYWEPLKSLLAPENALKENYFKVSKDLGLHLKRLGFESFDSLVFANVPVTEIGQLDPNMFCISGVVKDNEETFIVTFDFDHNVLNQLKGKIPQSIFDKLNVRTKDSRAVLRFADHNYFLTIDCKIGQKLEENDMEIFLPLIVNKFIDDQ